MPRIRLPISLLAIAFLTRLPAAVWMEAENPSKVPEATTTHAWSGADKLSGGRVLAINVGKRDMESTIPKDGITLRYPFRTSDAGPRVFWNRVVFENIRTPFSWRVNGGEWQSNTQESHPINQVQELAFWNPVGWTRMGEQHLEAGEHLLEIRIDRQADDKGNPADVRYISDALLIAAPDVEPHFKYLPGSDFPGKSDGTPLFTLEESGAPRVELHLTGDWEVAPWEESGPITNAERVAGTEILPDLDSLNWHRAPVPANLNASLPDLRYVHRKIMRTRLAIPESFEGGSFLLTFEKVNLILSLFIDGEKVDDFDIVQGQWRVDATDHLEAGNTHELVIVVKDTYYAMELEEEPGMFQRYYPESLFHGNQGVTRRFDFPAANGHGETGLLDVVRLEATRGPAVVTDVFIKPFPVTRGEIAVDVDYRNQTGGPLEPSFRHTLRTWPEGVELRTLDDTALSAQPGDGSFSLTFPSNLCELWWPYDPALYELVTEVSVDGKVIDRATTRFGNREWELRGNKFYLNGVQHHLRTDLTHYTGQGDRDDAVAAVAEWRDMGINNFRQRFQDSWFGMTERESLEFFDEMGVPVRLNTGTFDGQIASYNLVEGDRGNRRARRDLFDRWRAQILNGARARKNHPSVLIWELDNELVFINARNFGLLDEVEPEFRRTSEELMAYDPTRATVIGGGAALRDESLPTYGIHYFEVDDRHYPTEAYTAEKSLARENSGEDGRVWPVDFEKKPIFFSETAFLPGRNPAGFAAVGGEVTFLGKRQARPAAGKIASWLAEGYRWKGFGAVHFWFDKNFTDGSYTYAWQPVAVLRRQWGDTFGPGESVVRDLRVYNDLPDERPITAAWALVIDGNPVAGEEKAFDVAPGGFSPWSITFTTPDIDIRTPGVFRLTASRAGEEVFRHDIQVELVPEPAASPADIDGPLLVWDPDGAAADRLRTTGYTINGTVSSLEEIPDRFGLLVVGRNALSASDATSPRWMALTARGNRMLFLEQEHPVHFQATPSDHEPTEYDGSIAFSQNLDHPVFEGVTQSDLDFWGGDEVVYRDALRKPTRGATSLVQVDNALAYSALLQVNLEDGLQFINQLAMAEKLDESVVARRLFDNLVRFAASYERVVRPVTLTVEDDILASTLAGLGLKAQTTTDPVAALRSAPDGIHFVEGTPENLRSLASEADLLREVWSRGGWLFVQNVTPDSLDAFNRIVGVDHVIRPFRQERVRFPAVRDPISSGLTQRDVVMSSGRRIQQFNRDEWPTDDAFDYILDLKDVAPFAEFPSPAYWNDPGTTGPGTDTWPLNMVNGYGADTHWRMVFSIHLANGDPTDWTMTLPREERISEIRIRPNRLYHLITEYAVTFDRDPATRRVFEVDPNEDMQVLAFDKPVPATEIHLDITDWVESGRADVLGIDTLEILVARPEGYDQDVRPLLNIGGLIRYPRGEGGVLLSQYRIREQESNPENVEKKKNVLSVLLKNLGAAFGGGDSAIAGYNLRYAPISLEDYANLYLTSEQSWPVRDADLAGLPKGENTFGGVRYAIRDFSTSPLESGVTLKHPRFKSNADAPAVQGIEVGYAADSLFFLHTFLEQREWKPRRNRTDPPVVFTYTVNYADGTKVDVPVQIGLGVTDWLQAEPKSLAEAGLAWMGDSGDPERKASVYQLQWNNPHPDKTIQSVDLSYGPDGNRWGVPVLLGITAGRVAE